MEEENGRLTERQMLILKAIVDYHISNGEPVGSKYLMQNEQLRCSSATIRNEMAELERKGYLEQPHTSAGRVPSERGYRFYVDALIEHYEMTAREAAVINAQLKSKMGELDQILVTASKLASSLTNYTGIAVKPKTGEVRIARFDAVYMNENNFLLVMVTPAGSAKTKHIHVDAGITQSGCSLLADALNRNIAGLTAQEITLPLIIQLESEVPELAALVNPIIKVVYDVMNELDSGGLKFSGVNRLLQYPEFTDVGQLQELLGSFEEEDDIINIVSDAQGDDINVVIGSESPVRVFNNSSFVFKPIVKDGVTLGAIGIIGPRRMDYAKVLSTLEGLCDRISRMLGTNELTEGGNQDGSGNEESE